MTCTNLAALKESVDNFGDWLKANESKINNKSVRLALRAYFRKLCEILYSLERAQERADLEQRYPLTEVAS